MVKLKSPTPQTNNIECEEKTPYPNFYNRCIREYIIDYSRNWYTNTTNRTLTNKFRHSSSTKWGSNKGPSKNPLKPTPCDMKQYWKIRHGRDKTKNPFGSGFENPDEYKEMMEAMEISKELLEEAQNKQDMPPNSRLAKQFDFLQNSSDSLNKLLYQVQVVSSDSVNKILNISNGGKNTNFISD
jgi:hypothetical protein